MILVGCLFGFLGDAVGGIFDGVLNVGDALTGGAISEYRQSATRKANMADWERQQKVLDQYQKGMVDYQNEANLAYNKELIGFQNEATKDMTKYMYDTYQSPTAKMNALKAAGVNPNLVAGSLAGTSIGATASSSSAGGSAGNIATASGNKMDKPRVDPMMFSQLEYQQEVNKMAKLKNEEQELINAKEALDLLGSEYDEQGNKRSYPERLKAGLAEIADQRYNIRRSDYILKIQKNATLLAEEVLAEMEALNDTEAFKKMKEKGIFPYLEEAMILAAEGDIVEFEKGIAELRKKGAMREDAWDEALKQFVTMPYNFPKELKWAEPLVKYLLRILSGEQIGTSVISGMLPTRRTNKLMKTRRRMSETVGGIKYQREDYDYY